MRIDSLFITHNGLTEPLGRAQIMPYVIGLARRGLRMEIFSFEPAGTDPRAVDKVRDELAMERVGWRSFVRSPSHALARKVLESAEAARVALFRAISGRPRIVHARSHLPAAVADVVATSLPKTKLLFDCRGMVGDEYVDAGHWTRDRLEYKLLKREEARLFRRSEGIVVLTHALRDWLRETRAVPEKTPIQVIPCCVDAGRFKPDPELRRRAREELGLGDAFVVAYSGSLGTWYLQDEMAALVKRMIDREPGLRWLVLTPTAPEILFAAADRAGISRDRIVVRKVPPPRMAEILPAADVGLSFIKPCFSKMGSSPTKVAEYLQAGLVAVVNGDIGDQAELAEEQDSCVVIPAFGEAALDLAAERTLVLGRRPQAERAAFTVKTAHARFGLEEIAIPRYAELYDTLLR